VLWTGTSAENPISTVGFQPDFTWIKGRDNNTGHILVDAVRGATKVLESDLSAAEYTNAQSVKSFDTNGFTLGTENDVNNSTAGYNQYVAWNWLAANGTSTPSGGSIASTVSANPSAGFSIVSYTGTGTAGTVAHGLGVAPSVVIVKNRDDGTKNWPIQFTVLGNNYLELNNANGTFTGSGYFNNTAPTLNVFSVGTVGSTNALNDDFIAYCFAEVEGYSSMGSYAGNGNADGPFVYTGFRPAFVIIKRTDFTASWTMWDSTRNSYNPAGRYLHPDVSQQEYDDTNSYAVDMLSNGFKLRTTFAPLNHSSGTFIYMAFAEHPFGGDGVSPATAR